MNLDADICYRALSARDRRFDGVFFVGVKSTGIYCRPICSARTPGRDRCGFYPSAALAEHAGFRPCLRCRPELAPGHAPVDATRTVARAAATRIEAGALNDGNSLEDLAASFALSSRQLRRVMQKELGVSPVQLAQTTRLLLAKRLIAETTLPMIDVAFAAGFESVRRFNALFQSHYRLQPSSLRRASAKFTNTDCVRLTLSYRPPFDWAALLQFLSARAIPGVECVTAGTYHRTVGIGEHRGWLSVTASEERPVLIVEMATALTPVLPAVLFKLRNLFDLDARPDIIDSHLAADVTMQTLVRRQPGLRLPGAFDGFELGMRAILGQQVSVRGASTLAGRVAEQFGEAIETPLPCLNRLTPAASAIVTASTLVSMGLPNTRAEGLRHFATAVAQRDINLDCTTAPEMVVTRLKELPGIGPWTAEYIAMRALRWPDAFPASDLGLLKAAGVKSVKVLEHAAESWRPWRAYAAMHLWHSLSLPKKISSKE